MRARAERSARALSVLAELEAHCLRNTRQIAEAFGPLAPMRMYARGGEGPEVTFVEARPQRMLSTSLTTRSTRCWMRAGDRRTSHC